MAGRVEGREEPVVFPAAVFFATGFLAAVLLAGGVFFAAPEVPRERDDLAVDFFAAVFLEGFFAEVLRSGVFLTVFFRETAALRGVFLTVFFEVFFEAVPRVAFFAAVFFGVALVVFFEVREPDLAAVFFAGLMGAGR